MKCHYDVLNVSRDADDDGIKKSYRKLALKWHPDKNPDSKEECTREFHLIQQAYDILSDPQERAWYDKHREAILKGGLGHGEKYEDKSLNVYQYFNTSCFSGYTDYDDGFYTVYRTVFETVADEDDEYREDRDSECEPPSFGDSKSSYEEVVGAFYAYWESYCTAKSYVWVEQYDTRQLPNRQYRRAAEAENKKARDKAKKERNEEVRALVAFVRKRDKRVQARKKLLEERAQEIARRAEERKHKDREHRRKGLDNYKEADWMAMSEKELESLEANVSQQFGMSEEEEDEEEEGEEIFDDLFCIACNKPFKTDKALANHEKSKKHRENVAFLRAQMQDEDGEDTEGSWGGESGDMDQDKQTLVPDNPDDPLDEDLLDLDEEEPVIADSAPKTKLSKKKKVPTATLR